MIIASGNDGFRGQKCGSFLHHLWYLPDVRTHSHMNQQDFLRMVQSRSARTCIGPSTVRGRGNAGAVVAARDFLRTLSLAPFGVANRATFDAELNRTTEQL